MAAGYIVEGAAKIRAPVDTGRLRNSYGTEVTESNPNMAKVQVSTVVEYAEAVEMGTSTTAAKPHLRPALDENETRIKMAITNAMRHAIQEVLL